MTTLSTLAEYQFVALWTEVHGVHGFLRLPLLKRPSAFLLTHWPFVRFERPKKNRYGDARARAS